MSSIAKGRDTNERMTELQSQRTELAAELERLTAESLQLQEELEEASQGQWQNTSGALEEGAAGALASDRHERLPVMAARISDLSNQLGELDRELGILAAVVDADRQIAEAMQGIAAACEEATALQERQDQISERIKAMEEEVSKAGAVAEESEHAAAKAIASAEDGEAEVAARNQMDKAIELALATEASVRMKRRAIDAMAAEAARLTLRIDECDQLITKGERVVGQIAFLKLSEQWNQKAEELQAIGLLLAAADRLQDGHRLIELRKLDLPLLGTKSGLSVCRADLLTAAQGAGISLNDLASA